MDEPEFMSLDGPSSQSIESALGELFPAGENDFFSSDHGAIDYIAPRRGDGTTAPAAGVKRPQRAVRRPSGCSWMKTRHTSLTARACNPAVSL